jgi:beta-ketodecanoyl-[acyl-carrier-protein] synthase
VSYTAVISGSGVFTPPYRITNAELVESYNAFADKFNAAHAVEIEAGVIEAKPHSSDEFIRKASGIENRYVMAKEGLIDPDVMHPLMPERSDDQPSVMAEMAMDAAKKAMDQAGVTADDIDLVICAASNMERAYPAMAVEIQSLLGCPGFAFDMNVACSSATFGMQAAADMIKAGSVRRVLMVNPEICSAHVEFRDRDCHFIFGDVCTAVVLEREEDAKGDYFEILSTRCASVFSNNIRNNNGFLRWTRPYGLEDRRDMQFIQNGRKVFKEVLPMVSSHILNHLQDENLTSAGISRLWLHQANKNMNDFIGRKVMGREPSREEQPNILQDYANTSSAGSIITFSRYSADLDHGDVGVICSFGAGYSVGSVVVRRHVA